MRDSGVDDGHIFNVCRSVTFVDIANGSGQIKYFIAIKDLKYMSVWNVF